MFRLFFVETLFTADMIAYNVTSAQSYGIEIELQGKDNSHTYTSDDCPDWKEI
jgi:hypothetical protein